MVVEEGRVFLSGVSVHRIEDLGGLVKEVAFPVDIFGAIRAVGAGNPSHSQRGPTVSSRPMAYLERE